MPSDADRPDGEPSTPLEDLANSVDLSLQSPVLIGGKPDERLDHDLNLPAGATLVPDTSHNTVHEQRRIVASLARWGQRTQGCLSREEPVPRVASHDVRVEVGQQQDAALDVLFGGYFGVLARHPRRCAVEIDLG